jgi:hypothetical protein
MTGMTRMTGIPGYSPGGVGHDRNDRNDTNCEYPTGSIQDASLFGCVVISYGFVFEGFAIDGGLSGTPHLLYTETCLGSLRDYFGTLTATCTSIYI